MASSSLGCGSSEGDGDGGGGSGATTGGGGDGGLTAEEFLAQCPTFDDPDTCRAQTYGQDALNENTPAARCRWVQWVEITDATTCAVGEQRGECIAGDGVDICSSPHDDVLACTASKGEGLIGRLEENGKTYVAIGPWCGEGPKPKPEGEFCNYDASGDPADPASWDDPACACVCDTGFPPVP